MSTGIGAGISPVFNLKPGSGAIPGCDSLYSVDVNNTAADQTKYLSNNTDELSLGLNGIGDFSISFWMYPTNLGTSSNMRVISFGSGSTLPFTNIYINNAGTGLQLQINGGGNTINDGSGAFTLVENEWVHMTFAMSRTANVSTSNWYANGVNTLGPVDKTFPQATNILINTAGHP